MMRIRITNGQATSLQLTTLAELAERLGNSILDITTRQQIELRAIRIGSVPQILRALEGVSLSSLQTGMDNVRNVNTCPLAGLTRHELLDASAIGSEFTAIFLGNKEFTNLPRKLNVTITGCMENCTSAESQDIAMTPAVRTSDGAPGFNVAVGGKMGSGGMTVAWPLDAFVEPHDAARLAAYITLLFRDEGVRDQRTRNRLAFLIEAWGIQRFRDALEERWGRALERAQRDVRLPRTTDHLGVQPQRQHGLYAMGLCVPTGRLNAGQLRELARLADSYGSGEVRFTTGQNAILVNIPEERLQALSQEPLLQDFSPSPHPLLRGLVTCTGTDYCNLALIETKSIGKRLAESMAQRYPHAKPITMHWSGCPAGCGNHQAADIGFQGGKVRVNNQVVDAVSIYVGGRTGPQPHPGRRILELVPVEGLEEVLPRIIENLELFKKVQEEPAAEGPVLMVPALV